MFLLGALSGIVLSVLCISSPSVFVSKRVIIINNIYVESDEKGAGSSEDIEQKVDLPKKTATFFSYNAEAGQTDGNPRRTASGNEVRNGIVANNCLPFGSIIEVEGIGKLEVQDRMNKRYGCDVFDVFVEDPAHNFKKTLKYTII